MSVSPLKIVAALSAAKAEHKAFLQQLAGLVESGKVVEGTAAGFVESTAAGSTRFL